MKFKKGDAVYLKAVVDDIKDHATKGIRCNLGYEVGYIHCEDYHLFTKQEMLKELQKPEIPKVGEVWREQHGCHAKIMCLSEDNIFFEFQDRLNSPGSLTIEEFLERFEKVED